MIARFALVAVLMFATSAVADVPASSLARIVVPSHDIKRGDVIGDSDLVYQNVNAAGMIAGIASSMDQLDGMEARRFLHAGEALRLDDVRHPILVTKGSNVTMTFSAPGISLTATGKAMSEGGVGDSVTVLNPVSYKQISAVVTGSGQVRVGDPITDVPAQLASAQP